MKDREVRVFLPRFEIRSGTIDLVDASSSLGVTRAFQRGEADFSGMNGVSPPDPRALYISNAFHQAFAEVNEVGTQAAAASLMDVRFLGDGPIRRPAPPPDFRADHPFVFAIRDRKTGAILFLGRVTDPTR
jgi:serpin B